MLIAPPRRVRERARRTELRRGAAVLRLAAVFGLALAAGGALVAVRAYSDEGSPQQVVRGYFAALRAGDASRALSYGIEPIGARGLLTDRVLAEQQRIAPISAVRDSTAVRRGARANVQVRYRLGFTGQPQDITATVPLRRVDGRWRMTQVAARTQLVLTQAADRATLLGGAVPASSVLLFPGATPVRFDSAYLRPDPTRDHLELGSGQPQLDLQAQPTPAGRRAAIGTVASALRACLAGRGPLTCPLPTERYVPGSLRGALPADAPAAWQVSVLDAAAGVLEVTGAVRARAAYRRLDFDNTASAGSGMVELPIRSDGYAVAPLRMTWQRP